MMQQTSIDRFFKTRKRPAADLISRKGTTRKLFAEDGGPSSPVRSPVRRAARRKDEAISSTTSLPEEVPSTKTSVEVSCSTKSSEQMPSSVVPPEKVSSSTKSLPVNEEAITPTRSPYTQTELQKKLSLGEFKNVIRQNKRYKTLKASLDKVNATTSHLKTIEESISDLNRTPELKKFDAVEFEINSSPLKRGTLRPRRLFGHETTKSPRKDLSYVSPRKLLDEGPVTSPVKPAYERYQHLLADGKDSLPLPPKYIALQEIFNSLETLVRMATSRGELVTFKRIRSDVQAQTRRNFTEAHLGMIKTVYPAAFGLAYERVKAPFCREETLELVISKSDYKEINITKSKKMFEDLLLEITKNHHQEFLSTLDPPLIVSIDQVRRWHPSFELNDVPDIEPTPIYRPTVNSKDTNISAKDLLEKTHKIISCNKRMERAVSHMVDDKMKKEADKAMESSNMQPAPIPAPSPIAALEKALKGIPKSLLEKIRAKKAAKMIETITQTPEQAKEAAMLSRLPELARITRQVFVVNKKEVLQEDFVLSNVGYSFKEKMTKNDLKEHLRLIYKHVPGWLNFFPLMNTWYIRLSTGSDINRVAGKLENLAKQSAC